MVQFNFILPTNVVGSKLSCMLLHKNSGTYSFNEGNTSEPISFHYNPFYNIAVNMRPCLTPEKVVPHDSEKDRDQNIVWKTTNTSAPNLNPISGKFHYVFASFEVVDGDCETPLFLIEPDSTSDIKLKAVPPTTHILIRALR